MTAQKMLSNGRPFFMCDLISDMAHSKAKCAVNPIYQDTHTGVISSGDVYKQLCPCTDFKAF